jgi:hypothetical protein
MNRRDPPPNHAKLEVPIDEAAVVGHEASSLSIWRPRRRRRTGCAAHGGRRSSNEASRRGPVVFAHVRKRSSIRDAPF